MSTATQAPRAVGLRGLLSVAAVGLVLVVVLTSPEPPDPDQGWRWATVGLGVTTCAWNVTGVAAAFRRTGPVSLVAFFHLWLFFAFSLPITEAAYRYDVVSLGYWGIATDDPLLFRAAVLLVIFQVTFFLALGGRVDGKLQRLVASSRTSQPDKRVGVTYLLLLLPLLVTRVQVLSGLGVGGMATSMVTRTDYFSQFSSGVSPIVWALNTAFPVYGVALGCLAVKYLVPHPTALGRRLFLGVFVVSTAGVALSGGRAELVFVSLTVWFFLYVAGYRSLRQFGGLPVLTVLVAALLFAVAQARHGEENLLSRAADGTTVGRDYSAGDVTQVLGLGRADAMVLILDRHVASEPLMGSTYLGALTGGVDETFIPRIAAGVELPSPTVSADVIGPWVFGGPQVSILPSAPGEAYLNFGYLGVLGAAVLLGLLVRGLMNLCTRLPGTQEFTVLLMMWTMARLLSDESAIVATFMVRNWPVIVVVLLVARRAAAPTVTPLRAAPAPVGSP